MIPSQAFSCEICGIPLSKFYIEHLWMATSIYCSIWTRLCTQILIVLALMKGYNVCSILNVSYQLKSTRKFYRLLWDDITSVEEIIMRWYHICGGDYYEMISHLWKRWASYIQIAGDKLVQSSPSKSIQKQFTALFKFCQLSSLLLILNMFQRRIRTLLNICREHFAKKVNNFLAVN